MADPVRRLDARGESPESVAARLRVPGGFLTPEVRNVAREIVERVRELGDAAVREYTERFDGLKLDVLRVPEKEIEDAYREMEPEVEEAFGVAIENVRRFSRREMPKGFEIRRGGEILGQRVRPIRRAGIYAPGGHGAYPSSLIMSAVPALVAGVDEVCVCASPGRDGGVNRSVLGVARMLGLDEVYAIGGAQAVAAMAHGTESVPAVEKVFGPGNDFVTAAKLEVFGTVGIDAPQGPSDVVVIADASAFPERVALDLMAQAEHLSGASAILLTPSENLIDAVAPLLSGEPAKLVTLVRTEDLRQAAAVSNAYAPEHAHVISEDHELVVNDLRAVGMLGVGDFSPIALSDYAAGPSHVLPTGGTAAWASPRSVNDFLVRTNYMQLDADALDALAPHVSRLARLEGFENHARSVEVRARKAEGKGPDV
ncbi:histidinol dehydrogenase [Rubrobacter radiotolerans]|uniref:Histidinol dehydrogenase n=1 Tax=Rubrobacter radiotolerans TaxID=42256 RepID=A0AB35T2D5_RUBRA|nr:histidinol dehydrogenase [Rubrobacter radiotolerans]MDX5893781.1 histidinol dehydrogenase [Rubrobacter radiotolerans]